MKPQGLVERLASGGDFVVAEGYLLEFERRGYLQAGSYVPVVVVKHPDLVKALHEEFVHAGSDVVLAFTYYGHREKLRVIGKEDLLENLNLNALKIARAVADDTGTLMAGNICNSTVYQKDNQEKIEKTEAMFKEQIEWAVQCGADFIVGETYFEFGEAQLALDSVKKYGNGADCSSPRVPFKTTHEHPTMMGLIDPETGRHAYPENLCAHVCSRTQIEEFAEAAKELGVQYVGLCCGNCASFTRIIAETYGRRPPASKYAPDMSQQVIYGYQESFSKYYISVLKNALVGSNK